MLVFTEIYTRWMLSSLWLTCSVMILFYCCVVFVVILGYLAVYAILVVAQWLQIYSDLEWSFLWPYINFISPIMVARDEQKCTKRTDRDRQYIRQYRVSKHANITTTTAITMKENKRKETVPRWSKELSHPRGQRTALMTQLTSPSCQTAHVDQHTYTGYTIWHFHCDVAISFPGI